MEAIGGRSSNDREPTGRESAIWQALPSFGPHSGSNDGSASRWNGYPALMRRGMLPIAVLVALLALSAITPAPAAADWERSCGSLLVHYRDQGGREAILAKEITGHNLRCRGARNVARAYASRSHYSRTNLHGERVVRNRFSRAVGRFRCTNERLGSDIRPIYCHDDSDSVDFVWYDSSGYH